MFHGEHSYSTSHRTWNAVTHSPIYIDRARASSTILWIMSV